MHSSLYTRETYSDTARLCVEGCLFRCTAGVTRAVCLCVWRQVVLTGAAVIYGQAGPVRCCTEPQSIMQPCSHRDTARLTICFPILLTPISVKSYKYVQLTKIQSTLATTQNMNFRKES
jgi:hypothetical protein